MDAIQELGLLTSEEVAKILKVTVGTLYQYAHRDLITPLKARGDLMGLSFYTAQEVKRYIAECYIQSSKCLRSDYPSWQQRNRVITDVDPHPQKIESGI